jgi:hypothetical protein
LREIINPTEWDLIESKVGKTLWLEKK